MSLAKQISFLIFLIFLIVVADARNTNQEDAAQATGIHHLMTKREIEKYFGVQSHDDVPDYEVVAPFQADDTGEFLSYKLHTHARQKRDARREPDVWYYNVKAFGVSLHLNLTKNNDLLAPGFYTEVLHKNGSRLTDSSLPRNTFYNGHVMSDPSSSVAISNGDGLKGMIHFLDQTFFMHPLPTHLAVHSGLSGGAQAHVLYRRSVKDTQSWCGVKDAEVLLKRSVAQTPLSRKKRESKSAFKYLETAIIGDNLLLERYPGEGARDHLIMLAHIVNSIFHDSSIGPIKVTIVLVRISLIYDGLGYEKSSTKQERIGQLAKWVDTNIPPKDDDPRHADTAVLLTRYLAGGLALFRSTCHNAVSRSVNGDIGLQTALIIAHEIGHTMGAGHDSPACSSGSRFIMATSVPSGKTAKKWSLCSRDVLQEFLSGPSSWCLDDRPKLSNIIQPSSSMYHKLPGQLVNGDEQCRMQYGKDYKQCPQMKGFCSSLYCTKGGSECNSISAPVADGTTCGDKHWCIHGECVDDGSPMIDGGWSTWSEYSPCSMPCDGGVHSRSRTCTDPSPQSGGRDCEGASRGQWKICNPKACDPGTTIFRTIQCTEANPKSSPFFTKKEQCKLFCKVKRSYASYGMAKDGTRCVSDRFIKDVCIEHVCRSVGCDNVLESGIEADRCGICNGDSSKCALVTGTYSESCPGIGPGKPCTIIDLPVGSSEVFVMKLQANFDALAVQTENGQYVYGVPSWSTTRVAAGTKIVYTKKARLSNDTLYIKGPTTEPLKIVYVDFTNKNKPVRYRYFTRESETKVSGSDVHWTTSEWSSCSLRCAGGVQSRTVKCVRKDDGSFVNVAICLKNSQIPPKEQACKTHACDPEWYTTRWRPCSKTCGKGIQTREIVCQRKVVGGTHESLTDSSCAGEKPEPAQRSCNAVACPPEWIPSEWGKCTEACGGGLMTRTLSCQQRDEHDVLQPKPDVMCTHAPKLQMQESCNDDVICSEIGIACFRAYPGIPLNETLGDLTGEDPDVMIDACAQLAHNKHYTYFGVGDNGKCYSSRNAETEYFTRGVANNANKCPNNVGIRGHMFVFSFYAPPKIEAVGCFIEDLGDRALPENYASFRGQINWKDMRHTINQCAYVAQSLGFAYFGVQNYAECWSGKEAPEQYNKHGQAADCWSGVGGEGRNFVYRFV